MGVGICLVNNPHSLEWSPFIENQLAVATSNRPGHTPISGIIYLLSFLPKNEIEIEHQIQLNVGCQHILWSHRNESILLSSCHDNVLRFFDTQNTDCMYREWFDTQSISNLDWDKISLEWIITGGIDSSIKLYHENQDSNESLQTFHTKKHELVIKEQESNLESIDDLQAPPIHDIQWNTHSPMQFLTTDRDGFVCLWDLRQEEDPCVKSFRIHNKTCALKMDLNIFDENSLALGCFDNSLMTYDLRNVKKPKSILSNIHYSQITSTQWSPHTQHLVATSSTDRTLRIWDMRESNNLLQFNNDTPNDSYETEVSFGGRVSNFKNQKMEDWVNDIAWNIHEVGLMALCCNDQLVKAYNIKED
ncbi:predicted protein [Naegleria gruberi]|uniref:Peroxin-7 n=1 Tax=Naegleria gruberi TaxID=5762 RepID=D2W688_NAEGR|nr:uncharacterized protein NAEGRDRAFT_54931 [Naegleria gruberi]EFC35414.1 predicted protein [Naegleria gruberi]|eukprot:XP_002668158.1 predicted protein [Naegleria gruberi strain NEG-M]